MVEGKKADWDKMVAHALIRVSASLWRPHTLCYPAASVKPFRKSYCKLEESASVDETVQRV